MQSAGSLGAQMTQAVSESAKKRLIHDLNICSVPHDAEKHKRVLPALRSNVPTFESFAKCTACGSDGLVLGLAIRRFLKLATSPSGLLHAEAKQATTDP